MDIEKRKPGRPKKVIQFEIANLENQVGFFGQEKNDLFPVEIVEKRKPGRPKKNPILNNINIEEKKGRGRPKTIFLSMEVAPKFLFVNKEIIYTPQQDKPKDCLDIKDILLEHRTIDSSPNLDISKNKELKQNIKFSKKNNSSERIAPILDINKLNSDLINSRGPYFHQTEKLENKKEFNFEEKHLFNNIQRTEKLFLLFLLTIIFIFCTSLSNDGIFSFLNYDIFTDAYNTYFQMGIDLMDKN